MNEQKNSLSELDLFKLNKHSLTGGRKRCVFILNIIIILKGCKGINFSLSIIKVTSKSSDEVE